MNSPDGNLEVTFPGEEEGERFLDDLALFVNDNSAYYMRKWYVMVHTGRILSWNWAAFSFPWIWLAYRKMYLFSLVSLCLATTVELFLPSLDTIVWLTLAVACGALGNFLYYYKAVHKVLIIRAISVPEIRTAELLRRGSTSWGAVIVVFLLFCLIYYLLLRASEAPQGPFDMGNYGI